MVVWVFWDFWFVSLCVFVCSLLWNSFTVFSVSNNPIVWFHGFSFVPSHPSTGALFLPHNICSCAGWCFLLKLQWIQMTRSRPHYFYLFRKSRGLGSGFLATFRLHSWSIQKMLTVSHIFWSYLVMHFSVWCKMQFLLDLVTFLRLYR